jgi:beta-lactamase regulating signal transducer with metallopeptidase domain
MLWIMAARRYQAVGRLLDGSTIKSRRAARLLRNVSRRFGLKHPIKLLVVDAQISPMLWSSRRNAVIVLPRHFIESLSNDGLRNILAHELSHYVRRDHWANLLSFAVATLFWWNPIAWLARRERAAAAEACSDALAMERLRGSRKSYATTLLTVVDSLAPRATMQSAFGIAFGESSSIRRRFELISDSSVHARMTRGGWLLLAIGLLTLVLVPALGAGTSCSSSGGQTQIEVGRFCCPSFNS